MTVSAIAKTDIDEDIMERASAIYAAAGLTLDDAFARLLEWTAAEQAVPFELLRPNQQTIEAMEAARRGELTTYSSIEELMADLHADD